MMHCDDCRNYETKPAPWQVPDPVSGLTPRYKPGKSLPPGAVLIRQLTSDWYWSPDGYMVSSPTFEDKEKMRGEYAAAARALGLPLAGEDLAEGEEAWTWTRIYDALVGHDLGAHRNVEDWVAGAWEAGVIGLCAVRRWSRGWICRRIAKPAPEPTVEQPNEWKRLALRYRAEKRDVEESLRDVRAQMRNKQRFVERTHEIFHDALTSKDAELAALRHSRDTWQKSCGTLDAEVKRLRGILADIARGAGDCLARNKVQP